MQEYDFRGLKPEVARKLEDLIHDLRDRKINGNLTEKEKKDEEDYHLTEIIKDHWFDKKIILDIESKLDDKEYWEPMEAKLNEMEEEASSPAKTEEEREAAKRKCTEYAITSGLFMRDMITSENLFSDFKQDPFVSDFELSLKYDINREYVDMVKGFFESSQDSQKKDRSDLEEYKLLKQLEKERQEDPEISIEQLAIKYDESSDYIDMILLPRRKEVIEESYKKQEDEFLHISEENIRKYLGKKLSTEDEEMFCEHVNDCNKCLETLAHDIVFYHEHEKL